MNRKQRQFYFPGFTDASLLGIGTAASYFMAYLYEMGHCDAYGIPLEHITVSISTTCLMFFGLSWLLLVPWALLSFQYSAEYAVFSHNERWRALVGPILSFVPCLAMLAAARFDRGVLLACGLVFTLTTGPAAWNELFKSRSANAGATEIDKASPGRHSVNHIMWLTAMTMVGSAYFTGYGRAKACETYLLYATNSSELVVLRRYGDFLIMAPIDRQRKLLKPERHFMHLAGDDPAQVVPFKIEHIGPLAL